MRHKAILHLVPTATIFIPNRICFQPGLAIRIKSFLCSYLDVEALDCRIGLQHDDRLEHPIQNLLENDVERVVGQWAVWTRLESDEGGKGGETTNEGNSIKINRRPPSFRHPLLPESLFFDATKTHQASCSSAFHAQQPIGTPRAFLPKDPPMISLHVQQPA